jgi:hypothetical protein
MTISNPACPRCNAPRQGNLRFCANCGFDYGEASPADVTDATQANPAIAPVADAAAEVPQATDDAPEGRPWLRWVLIAVGVLLVIGFIGSLGDDDPESAAADGSPTPEATADATQATESSDPTEEPTPQPTPVPTAEPTATPPPTPTPAPTPAFATIELSGTGNAVPRFDIPEDAAAIAAITHSGASNFAVWAVDASGNQTDLLVNTIGSYSGTLLFDEQGGSHTDAFEVEADGSWTITINPVTEAFRWNGSETLSGSGDDVVILDPASSGLKSTTLTHSGEGNFAVWIYSPSGTDLAVNEIGQFSGEVLIADGAFLIEVTADGPWTASPPQ